MGKKASFDMFEIKERLNEAKYQEDKAKGFKITSGEMAVHIVVAIIAFSIFVSFVFSYDMVPVQRYGIIALLFAVLVWRVYKVLKMTTRPY